MRHVGQQMLDKDLIKQPPQKEHIQNTIKDKMQEIILGEGQLIIQNGTMICRSPNVSKT